MQRRNNYRPGKADKKILSKNQKIDLVNAFKDQVIQASHKKKEEVTGLLDDIRLKIENDQTVPKYQIEALKDYLAGEPGLKERLQGLLQAIAAN